MTRKQQPPRKPSEKRQEPCPLPSDQAHRALSLTESFSYAWCGVRYLFRTQRNARIHLLIAAAALVSGVFLRLSLLEMAIVVVVIGVVIVAEMFNTAVEAVIDLATEEWNQLAKAAKDVAAAAVLAAAIVAVLVGSLVFGPHIAETISAFTPPV